MAKRRGQYSFTLKPNSCKAGKERRPENPTSVRMLVCKQFRIFLILWFFLIKEKERIRNVFFICSFVLPQKNQKVKENLKALRWSFIALAFAIRATTIPSVIAQEAAPPNFPLPPRFIMVKDVAIVLKIVLWLNCLIAHVFL